MMKRILSFTLAFIGLIILFNNSFAFAADRGTSADIYSGWESNFDGQGYALIGAALEERLSEMLALRAQASGSYLYYKFNTAGEELKARAPGADFLIGPRLYLEKDMHVSLLMGVNYRNTSLRPSSLSSLANVHGADTGFTVLSDFDYWMKTHTNIGAMITYSTAPEYTWGRIRLKQQAYNLDYSGPINFNVGAEGTGGGNRDYTQYEGGGLFEIYYIPAKTSLLLHGGYEHDTTHGDGGYGGIEVSKRF
jgi:Cellulose biosynthesis protein BcsS